MTRHYTTRHFFRQTPNALLARYFHERGLFIDLDFTAMKETKPDALFAAWLKHDEKQRNPLDAELSEIFDMSCKKGSLAIIDAARRQLCKTPEEITPFIETLSRLPNHYHRAMTTFLDHADYWKVATRFYHADTLSYWRKRKNFGHEPAVVTEASIQQFSSQIGDFFYYTQGCGKNCEVEFYRRDERDYFFAFPEDYSQQSLEWVDGKLKNRLHNPVFQVVFLYSQKEGSLDLNLRGSNMDTTESLQNIFATAILKLDELPPNPKDLRIYNLNPLKKQGFDFVFDLSSGIKSVSVNKLRFSSQVKKGRRLTLEANSNDANAIYKDIGILGKSTRLDQFNVTQVELSAVIAVDDDKPTKKVPIRITHPNFCSLKYDKVDLTLRNMLESSGIEPKEPREDADTTLNDVVTELLQRVATLRGEKVLINEDELSQWPIDTVNAIKTHNLIRKTRPATTVVCVECEEHCVRPVQTTRVTSAEPSTFIVCEKRVDVNHVPVSINRLECWQTSGELVAELLSGLLGLRRTTISNTTDDRWEIGMFKGRKHSSHLKLVANDSLTLTLAGHSIPLTDILTLENNQITINKHKLNWRVDHPNAGAGDTESAQQRRERLKKSVQEEKNKGTKAFLAAVADEEGISVSRLKQLLKDKPKLDNKAISIR